MRKQLLRAFWLGNAITIFVLALITMVTVLNDIKADFGSLRAILNTASEWTSEASSNLQEVADKIADSAPPLRVTFLMPNGIVLADSGENFPDGAYLIAQTEVKLAGLDGFGEHLSFHDSLIHPSVNAAMLLDGRLIIRLSNPIKIIGTLLSVYLPLIILVFLIMLAVSRRLLSPITRKIVRQLDQVGALLSGGVMIENIDKDAYFPELKPTMEHITYLIERMKRDLDEISKNQDMQRDFVDISSHELKSPLTSITGFAEIMHEDPGMPEEERKEYLGYILQECKRMTGIINDILMLEKQDRSDPAERKEVDLYKVASQVATALSPQAGQKNIGMTVTGQMTVLAVEQDMWELLRNLMGNAVRYGREGGFVRVHMGNGLLVVQDNGIGIPREHQERIFEKFYRVDSARDRAAGGTGLRLAIVAGICNRYKASIHLKSEPGQGSLFTIDFNRSPAYQSNQTPATPRGETPIEEIR